MDPGCGGKEGREGRVQVCSSCQLQSSLRKFQQNPQGVPELMEDSPLPGTSAIERKQQWVIRPHTRQCWVSKQVAVPLAQSHSP